MYCIKIYTLKSLLSYFSQLPCPAMGEHIRIYKENGAWLLVCLFKYYLNHMIEFFNKCIFVVGKENHICHIPEVLQCESLGNHFLISGKMEVSPALLCEKLQDALSEGHYFSQKNGSEIIQVIEKYLSKTKESHQIDLWTKILDTQLNFF